MVEIGSSPKWTLARAHGHQIGQLGTTQCTITITIVLGEEGGEEGKALWTQLHRTPVRTLDLGHQIVMAQLNRIVVAVLAQHEPNQLVATALNEEGEQEEEARQCDAIVENAVGYDALENVLDLVQCLT